MDDKTKRLFDAAVVALRLIEGEELDEAFGAEADQLRDAIAGYDDDDESDVLPECLVCGASTVAADRLCSVLCKTTVDMDNG